jgi:unsaturated rhamnogalacturonyl hydrolase
LEEARKQFLVHLQYLSDRRTGLFFHGFTFENNANFANALWARGNSWVTIVIPEYLELLDLATDDGYRQYLVEMYVSQVEALAHYQNKESGMWHTLIDDPTSYVESSAIAGFAFGILKGIRLKLISRQKYQAVALKAIHGLFSRIDENRNTWLWWF